MDQKDQLVNRDQRVLRAFKVYEEWMVNLEIGALGVRKATLVVMVQMEHVERMLLAQKVIKGLLDLQDQWWSLI
jgi:hypothetical protein